jgi:hypothetical protein
MSANTSSNGSGCGCGGGGGTLSVTTCGCGGGGCGSCQGQGIVRPRFFAGQLLTEDDLQLLTDYVGQKDRLHNRHLYGAGVVCGLDVSCHPCGDGRVIVHPGYALDCCGNDLTLSCAQILDINAMVRDLRRDMLGGFDCGDPCLDPAKITADTGPTTDAQGADAQPAEKPDRKYCLYIRYCEQASDPVMPYSTGEDCGRVACEPTRIREGIKFELRCDIDQEAINPLIRRICGCVGDINKFKEVLQALDELRKHTDLIYYSMRKDSFQFNDTDIANLKGRLQLLSEASAPKAAPAGIARDVITGVFISAKGTQLEKVRPQVDRRYVEAFGEVALLVNRYEDLPVSRQHEIQTATAERNFQEIIRKARTAVQQIASDSLNDSTEPASLVRDWLIERFQNSPFSTDCGLRERVLNLVLPTRKQEVTKTILTVSAATNQALIDSFINYLRDCFCRAFNPPCLPCEDSGVLLACLDVQDCKVVKVCNTGRTFVLSPAAVRYWLPPLQLMGNILDRLCCDPWDALSDKKGADPDLIYVVKQEITKIIKDSMCGISDETLKDLLGNLDGVFGSLSSAASGFTGGKSEVASEVKADAAKAMKEASTASTTPAPPDTAEAKIDLAAEIEATGVTPKAVTVVKNKSAKNPVRTSSIKKKAPSVEPAPPAETPAAAGPPTAVTTDSTTAAEPAKGEQK